MIQVSDAAAAKFREIAADTEKPGDQMLRISYGGVG